MKKYKITNKLECNIRIGDILFKPKETKVLDFKPTSDRFIVEVIREPRQQVKIQELRDKTDKNGETVSVVSKKTKLKRRKKYNADRSL